MTNANVAEVLPDGNLALPEEVKRVFADVKTFWVARGDGFLVLMPLELTSGEALLPKQALDKLREMVAKAGGLDKTPAEVIEELRAIRKQVWESEYRPKYAQVLEEYYASHPDRRPG